MHPELIRLASLQGGGVTHQQARQYHDWRQLSRFMEAGVVDDIGAARLAIPNPPVDLASRLRRGQIAVAHPLIAVGSTATGLAGFGVVDDGKLHVTTPDARSISVPEDMVLHQKALRAPPVTIAGILAADPADAALDAACAARDIDVLAILDAFLRRFWTDDTAALERLNAAMHRAKGQRGIRRVGSWIRYADPRAESPMESRTRARFIEAGLPAPDLQIEVITDLGRRYLDMGWRVRCVGADFEGEEFHTGDGAMQRDRLRHNAITDRSWTMFYPTARDVYVEHRNLVAIVRRALDRAGGVPATSAVPRPPAGWRPRDTFPVVTR